MIVALSHKPAPDMRGKGFSAICLTSSIDFFRKRFPHISVINATIKSSNIKSQKVLQELDLHSKRKTVTQSFTISPIILGIQNDIFC